MTGTRAQRPGRRVDPHVRIGKSGQGARCGRLKGLTFLFTDGFPLRVGGDERPALRRVDYLPEGLRCLAWPRDSSLSIPPRVAMTLFAFSRSIGISGYG
jgi:hypothetical protein